MVTLFVRFSFPIPILRHLFSLSLVNFLSLDLLFGSEHLILIHTGDLFQLIPRRVALRRVGRRSSSNSGCFVVTWFSLSHAFRLERGFGGCSRRCRRSSHRMPERTSRRIASRIGIVVRIHAVLTISFPAIETRIVTELTLTLVGLRKGTGNGPQGVILVTAVGVVTAGVFVVAGIAFLRGIHVRIGMRFGDGMFAVVRLRTRPRPRILRRRMHGMSRRRRNMAMVVVVGMTVMGIARIATSSISLLLVGRGVIRIVVGMMRMRRRRVVRIGITRRMSVPVSVSAGRVIMRRIRAERRAVVIFVMVVLAEVVGVMRRQVGRLVGMRGSAGGVFHAAVMRMRVIRRRRMAVATTAGVLGGMMGMVGRLRSAIGIIADDAPGRRPMRRRGNDQAGRRRNAGLGFQIGI